MRLETKKDGAKKSGDKFIWFPRCIFRDWYFWETLSIKYRLGRAIAGNKLWLIESVERKCGCKVYKDYRWPDSFSFYDVMMRACSSHGNYHDLVYSN